MSSRDEILASVRANLPRVDRPLPAVPMFDGSPAESLLEAFKKSLHQMGGIFLDPPASGDPLVSVRAKIADAKIVCSTVPEIAGNRDITGIGAPQDLADVDFAIVRASYAVAETGSVLLSDADLRVNASALAQHLIVLLDPADRARARVSLKTKTTATTAHIPPRKPEAWSTNPESRKVMIQ